MIGQNLARIIVFIGLTTIAWGQCPPDQVILNGASLGSGIAVGLNTSTGRTDWLSNDGSSLVMQYPSGQAWGSVFFTFGASAPVGSRTGHDISACQNLILEMMGDPGLLNVGIKDSTQPDDGTEPTVQVQISSQWQTYSIPLARFNPTKLKSLYVPAELNFSGPQSQALRVRAIRLTAGPATTTTTKLLPQLAFGGGWYSALYFANISDQPASVQVKFVGDDGKPMLVPSIGASSTSLNLPPRGTAILEVPNVGALTQGYASVALPDGVIGYGVFRQSSPGGDQEAVVPLSGSSNTDSTLIFDETAFVTGVAIVNASGMGTTVMVTVRDTSGQVIGTAAVPLPAGTKTATALRNLAGLSGVVGARGSADFTVASGSVAVLGLRFNGQAFTSMPASER